MIDSRTLKQIQDDAVEKMRVGTVGGYAQRTASDQLFCRLNALTEALERDRQSVTTTVGRCRTCRFWGKGLGPMNPYGLPVLPGNYSVPLKDDTKPREQREHGFCLRAAVFNGTGGWPSRRAPEASNRPLMLATLAYSHESHMETRFDFGCVLHEEGPEPEEPRA